MVMNATFYINLPSRHIFRWSRSNFEWTSTFLRCAMYFTICFLVFSTFIATKYYFVAPPPLACFDILTGDNNCYFILNSCLFDPLNYSIPCLESLSSWECPRRINTNLFHICLKKIKKIKKSKKKIKNSNCSREHFVHSVPKDLHTSVLVCIMWTRTLMHKSSGTIWYTYQKTCT